MKSISLKILLVFSFLSAGAQSQNLPWWNGCPGSIADYLSYQEGYQPPLVDYGSGGEIYHFLFGMTSFVEFALLPSDYHDPVFHADDRLVIERGSGQPILRSPIVIRDLALYRREFFPPELINEFALRTKRVFDPFADVRGSAVQEMRAEGIFAFGGGIYLTANAAELPFLDPMDPLHLPLVYDQFDVILLTEPLSVTLLRDLLPLLKNKGQLVVGKSSLAEVDPVIKAARIKAPARLTQGSNALVQSVTIEKP